MVDLLPKITDKAYTQVCYEHSLASKVFEQAFEEFSFLMTCNDALYRALISPYRKAWNHAEMERQLALAEYRKLKTLTE